MDTTVKTFSGGLARADDDLTQRAIRFLQACATRDVEYVAANSADDPSDCFTGITSGSDADWSRSNTIHHLDGLKQAGWADLAPSGFVQGDLAWFTALAYGVIPNGDKLVIRATLIMWRVDGDWKAVHFHVSEPVDREGIAKD